METKTAGQRLAEERAEILDRVNSIIDGAKSANRAVTAEEERESKDGFARIDEIDKWTTQAKAADSLMSAMSRTVPDPSDRDRDRYGAAGFNSEEVKTGLSSALRQKGSYGFNMPFKKEAISAGGLSLPSTGAEAYEAPPGDTVVALREIFEQQTTATGNLRYYVLDAGTGADVVEEGGLKPELAAGITPVDATLQKLAVRFGYTDELAEDANFLIAYIGREAQRSILQRENTLITDALAAVTGALTSTGTTAETIDVIAGAIGAAEATNGITPTRIVANPLDVAEIRTSKAAGSGEYTIDPLNNAPAGVHGVPLVPTPAVAQGTMYLTSPGLGAFYAHQSGLRIESGFATGDWEHNRVTTRVEERVLPAIVRPSLLTRITLTAAA